MFKEGDVVEYLGGGFDNLTIGQHYTIVKDKINIHMLRIIDDVGEERYVYILECSLKLVSPSAQSTLPKYIKWPEGKAENYLILNKVIYIMVEPDYVMVDTADMRYRIIKDDVTNFDEIKSILIKYFEEGL